MDDFKRELEDQNKTLADWAREHGFRLDAVYAMTRGLLAGRRGQSREILLAMRVAPPSMFKPTKNAKAAKAAA